MVVKNKATLKGREFWDHVERVAKITRALPDWMKGSPVNERPASPEYSLLDNLKLAEHKIDQHLQGQYNWLPYPALGVALAAVRRALLEVERGS